MQNWGTRKIVKILSIGIFLLLSSAIVSTKSEHINNATNDLLTEYQVLHIKETSNPSLSSSSSDKAHKNLVITYQQLQTLNHEGSKTDMRLLQVESKRGFDKSKSKPIYLFATEYKSQCQESAYFSSWKIDNGTNSNGEFWLKINYHEQLNGKNMYLCISDGNDDKSKKKHLGENSLFHLSR